MPIICIWELGVPNLSASDGNKKQCRLNKTGKDKLFQLISGLPDEEQSDVALARMSGLDRGTVAKIRNGDKLVTLSRIERLFNSINEDEDFLEEKYCEYVNPNRNLVEKSTSSSTLKVQPPSEPKVADLLFHLNYSEQERKFKEVIKSKSEAAFLIRAKEERIQRWLVRRLAGCVPGFQTAKRYEIRIRSHPMRSDFDAFWSEFERDLGKNLNREKVIQGLAKLSQYQSIIIAIRGFSSLDKEKMPQLFTFWSDLVNQVRSIPQSQRFFRARLVLLLAEGNSSKVVDRMNPVESVESPVVGEPKYPISLEPLEKILQTDVQTWLEQETVYYSLNRTDEEMQSIVCNDITNWDEEPSQTLEEICQTIFKMTDGIAAIEPYWKLVV